MHLHDHDQGESESLRSRADHVDEDAPPLLWRAAAAGRSDVVGPAGMLTMQRAVGNAGVQRLAEEERSPVLDVVSSGGRPLDEPVRVDMEFRLGHDFSDVRVHTDDAASRSAASVNAHAYTVGSNVVFQRDKYDPSSTAGRTMLAHELTHVVQQRSGPVDGTPTGSGIRVSDPSDRFEREAANNAERVMSGPAPAALAPTAIPCTTQTESRMTTGPQVHRASPTGAQATLYNPQGRTDKRAVTWLLGSGHSSLGVQREEKSSLGSPSGATHTVNADATSVADVAERGTAAGGMLSYPPCTSGRAPASPSLTAWLDNPALERIRHENGEFLSRTRTPSDGAPGAIRLLKLALRAWGCEVLGRDLLPRHGASHSFGKETAAAVEQLQHFSGLAIDGIVGRQTLAAIDRYLGVLVLPSPPTPSSVGGSGAQGRSVFLRRSNPVGRIFFATDDAALDSNDLDVLREMGIAGSYTDELELLVVGYADKRESARHNIDLTDRRAAHVQDELDAQLKRYGARFSMSYEAAGEIERPQPGKTDEDLKPFRRVDVLVVRSSYPAPPESDEDCLLCIPPHEPTRPKPRCPERAARWEARLRDVVGTHAILGKVSGKVDIRTAERDSKGRRWRITYAYFGLGLGASPPRVDLPGSYSPESGWAAFTTSRPVKATDFAGDAIYGSVALVPGKGVAYDRLRMAGPEKAGAEEVVVEWNGWSSGISIGASQDLFGGMSVILACEEF